MPNTPFPILPESLERDLRQLFKLLSDKTRLKIFVLLARDGEMDVTSLCERLNHSQPAISHHLSLMRLGGIIQMRREGKHNYYAVQKACFHRIIDSFFRSIDGEFDEFRFDNYVLSHLK